MYKRLIFIVLLAFCTQTAFSQGLQEELYLNFSSHNFLKHNRFFLNPTFSIVGENSTKLNFLSRDKFSKFNDSPQTYIGSYSGKVRDKVGVGLVVFQQNFGVFKNFGVLLNYSYQVKFKKEFLLAFGFNFKYSSSDIDRSKIITPSTDPSLADYQERPTVNFQPAINLTVGEFDAGIFLENLVDYDLNEYDFITPFSEKTFSVHLMYTKVFKSDFFLLKNGKLQFLNILRDQVENVTRYTSSLLLDLPKFGWVQTTYDGFYGISFGVGVNISEKVAIGFVYENGKHNLGFTNEISLTYDFGKHESVKLKDLLPESKPVSPSEELKELEKNQSKEKDTISKVLRNKPITTKPSDDSNKRNKLNPTAVSASLKEFYANQLILKDSILVEAANIRIKNKAKKEIEIKQDEGAPKIRIDKLKANDGLEVGYYVIVNVFAQQFNTNRFIEYLKVKTLKPGFFIHPKNNYRYVYLLKVDNKNDALEFCYSFANGKYYDETWIIHIE